MYDKKINTKDPGLIILLIDQSGSMAETYTSAKTKAKFAADAVNVCIFEIILACSSGNAVKPRCDIVVIGYGDPIMKLLLKGTATEVDAMQVPTDKIHYRRLSGAGWEDVVTDIKQWVTPVANAGTPMHKAFEAAARVATAWAGAHQGSFPPIVMNITDGAPDKPERDAEAEADKLKAVSTSDGKLLLFNAHIAKAGTGPEIVLPNSEPSNVDTTGQFIFRISSVLPAEVLDVARSANFTPLPGARGCVYNAGAENLTKLITFGGTLQTQAAQ